MEFREFGRTGWEVSATGVGTWAMGSQWGPVDDQASMAALHHALDLGVNFFDTADVYGSEHLLGRLGRDRSESFYVATKLGVRLNPDPNAYTRQNITAAVDGSLRELGVGTIDLMQLHVPPPAVYNAETFGILDELVTQGKLRYYGVSVERIQDALKAIAFPGVTSVQIIFNMFRQRPAEDFFPEAERRGVAIIARVPLASGLLTGKMARETVFAADDHRSFNREGQEFDQGETFAGVDFEVGLQAVDELRPLVPGGASMAQMALRWVLMFPAVSCVLAGARSAAQVEDDVGAADLPPLSDSTMSAIRDVYDRRIRAQVHHRW